MSLLPIMIFTGGGLITSIKTQHIINSLKKYEQAVYVFYLEYGYLPGDFPDIQVWDIEKIKNTCNRVDPNFQMLSTMDDEFMAGDGDGYVATGFDGNSYPAESDIISCHLGISGYLSFDEKLGRGVASYAFAREGRVFSGQTIESLAGYWIDNLKNYITIRSHIYDRTTNPKRSNFNHVPEKGNFIMLTGKHVNGFGSTSSMWSTSINSSILSSIDRKIDDNKPGKGKIKFGVADNYIQTKKDICSVLIYHVCSANSVFTNIDTNNINAGYIIYQPKWLHDLTE